MSISSIETFVVDLSTVADPDPLPVRTYEATVTEISINLSKNSGKPTLKALYFISPDQYPVDFDADNAPDGVTMANYSSANCGTPPEAKQPTKLGLARYRRLFETHGLPIPRLALDPREDLGGAWAPTADTLSVFIGSRVLVSVVHEAYEGRMQAKIGSVAPID